MSNKDPKGYYAILCVTQDAGAVEIKAAFRRRAMELHPDRNGASNATEQFQLLNEAYDILSDPETRAQYDTMSIQNEPRACAAEDSVEPIVCSCCNKVTAQPRYVIFYEVKSFLVQTTRSGIQGVFCSSCAEKKAYKASVTTWLLGWWGVPWGPIYSLQAIFTNMIGGKQNASINTRLAINQAWAFAGLGKADVARAIALDALDLSRMIEIDAQANLRKVLGYSDPDERTEIQAQIESLLKWLGNDGTGKRLKNSWKLLRRPFYLQCAAFLVVFCWLAIFFGSSTQTGLAVRPISKPLFDPSTARPTESAVLSFDSALQKAPNGEPWPISASYVKGFPRTHTDGLSQVTVDNAQNDSSVFVKLYALDGAKAFPVRVFFIPAHNSFKLSNVRAGNYDIRYKDLNSGKLSRSEPFALTETMTDKGTQYSDMTLTLYKVRNGNMRIHHLSEGEF